jgi:hypothetical protein
MRIGLVALAVVAAGVLVPTALLPRAAGRGYSVQQVLRVFAAEGMRLRREPVPVPSAPFEIFADHSSAGFVDVTVYQPGAARPVEGRFAAYGAPLPRLAHRGNVYVSELAPNGGSGNWQAVRRALGRLRYSRADAARPPLPTVVLEPGDRRALNRRDAPNGAEVECTNGIVPGSRNPSFPAIVAATVVVRPATRRARSSSAETLGTGTSPPRSAELSWRPRDRGSVLVFSCSARARGGAPGPGSVTQVVVNGAAPAPYGVAPPARVPGPFPPLQLPRPSFTLGNEYANVPAQTLREMHG